MTNLLQTSIFCLHVFPCFVQFQAPWIIFVTKSITIQICSWFLTILYIWPCARSTPITSLFNFSFLFSTILYRFTWHFQQNIHLQPHVSFSIRELERGSGKGYFLNACKRVSPQSLFVRLYDSMLMSTFLAIYSLAAFLGAV